MSVGAGLTVEKLAYEAGLRSKGYLSDIEKGLARPTVTTLLLIADRLEVELLDLFTFPEKGERHELIDRTRSLSRAAILRLLRAAKSGGQ